MGLFEWWKGRSGGAATTRLEQWRSAWLAAAEAADGGRVPELRQSLDALGLEAEDLEIEIEMIDGLSDLSAMAADLRGGQLPRLETGHRVVGSDTCHFIAPAALPDDPAQASGRVILTDRRAVFAGGGRATSVPWHRVLRVARQERDLLLILNDRETAHRFRFNSFSDALCGAALARHLAGHDRTAGL